MRNVYHLRSLAALFLMTALLTACGARANPKPGASLSGTIEMQGAKSANISLRVSQDGQSIESVSVAFTELKCEAFSAGSSSSTVSARAPIASGKFQFKHSNIGEISGQFTSPTSARGTAHLLFFDGKAECGTWNWSATGN